MSVLKLVPAAVIAAAVAGALGAPAIAAARTPWDEAGFNNCAQGYEAQREDDYVSWYYGVRQCCISFGGVWHDQQPGHAARCDPPPRIVRLPPGVLAETLAPAELRSR